MPKKKDQRKAVEKQLSELWQGHVKARDSNTCKWCGSNEGPMHAHHIVHKSRSLYLRWRVVNGICLCHKCHFKIHSGGMETVFLLWYSDNYIGRWKILQDSVRIFWKKSVENLRTRLEELRNYKEEDATA